MVEIKMDLEVSAQRMIQMLTQENEEIRTLVKQNIELITKRLEEQMSKPEFSENLDKQIEEAVMKAINDQFTTYALRGYINDLIKAMVDAKLKKLFEGFNVQIPEKMR